VRIDDHTFVVQTYSAEIDGSGTRTSGYVNWVTVEGSILQTDGWPGDVSPLVPVGSRTVSLWRPWDGVRLNVFDRFGHMNGRAEHLSEDCSRVSGGGVLPAVAVVVCKDSLRLYDERALARSRVQPSGVVKTRSRALPALPAPYSGEVYYCDSEGGVYRVDVRGRELGHAQLRGSVTSPPVVLGSGEVVVFARQDGQGLSMHVLTRDLTVRDSYDVFPPEWLKVGKSLVILDQAGPQWLSRYRLVPLDPSVPWGRDEFVRQHRALALSDSSFVVVTGGGGAETNGRARDRVRIYSVDFDR
jgi:hypothetical protein